MRRGSHTVEIDDPRNERRALSIDILVITPAVLPHGYGRDFDPGSDIEFEVTSVRNASGSLARLIGAHEEKLDGAVRAAIAREEGRSP